MRINCNRINKLNSLNPSRNRGFELMVLDYDREELNNIDHDKIEKFKQNITIFGYCFSFSISTIKKT